MSEGLGFESLMIAVVGSGVCTSVTVEKVLRPRGCTSFRVRIEKATSAEEKSLPSCHFTPERILKL